MVGFIQWCPTLWSSHPQTICILFVSNNSDILPHLTQEASKVFHFLKLYKKTQAIKLFSQTKHKIIVLNHTIQKWKQYITKRHFWQASF